MAENCVETVDNMILLGDLHEGSLLHNLRQRYRRNVIYTYVGTILLCLNPYEDLGYITLEWKKKYKGKGMSEDMPPHPFAVGDYVYNQMNEGIRRGVSEGRHVNQSVVISGESGAGKTVTTGHILEYLTFVTGKESQVQQQILSSGEMLETFGNAKTTRNYNSSRFGKFVEVRFDREGLIMGAHISHYLLEKSRVTAQSLEERNYHCFYQMFAGTTPAERAERWALSEKCEDYFYLSQSGCTLVPKIIDDKGIYEETKHHMETLLFPAEMQDAIWNICAAVLHIGNIHFLDDPHKPDAARIDSREEIEHISRLLKLDPDLLERALLLKVLTIQGKDTITNLTPQLARENAGALAKALYAAMFDWIVHRINETISSGEDDFAGFIGVLDIFGFEHFTNKARPIGANPPQIRLPNNHFEQFCINFANEMLQMFFNINIFEQEMALYRSEGIPTSDIKFNNNEKCIALIQDKNGFIDIMNDCSKPKPPTTWKQFRERLLAAHCTGKNWEPDPEKEQDYRPTPSDYLDKITKAGDKWKQDLTDIIIQHYAGPVQYTIGSDDPDAPADFLTKNKDKLSDDLAHLISSSTDPLLANILSWTPPTKAKFPTVANQFLESLKELIDKLFSTDAIFVRTIKPNNRKHSGFFEDAMTLEQLRCAGMLETIKVRRMGYPRKEVPKHFVERYRMLVTEDELAGKYVDDQAAYLLAKFCPQTPEQAEADGALYRMGQTRIFMKDTAYNMLEHARDERLRAIKELKENAALMLRCMYKTWQVLSTMRERLKEYEKRKAWNEEKLRRMKLTGKSADEVQREMEQEIIDAERAKYQELFDRVVGTARAEAQSALASVNDVTRGFDDLMSDHDEPKWTEEQEQKFMKRKHRIEEYEHAVNDALTALEAEYRQQKPGLVGYNESLIAKAAQTSAELKEMVQKSLDLINKEKMAHRKAVQEEILRKKREQDEEEERKRREEEEKRRVIAAEEEAKRVKMMRDEEEALRHDQEVRAMALRMELQQRENKRLEALRDAERQVEQRRTDARYQRLEAEQKERLALSEEEFRYRLKREQEEYEEKLHDADLALKEKQQKAAEEARAAASKSMDGVRVMFRARKATVRFVGRLPFFGAGEFVGIECDEFVGRVAGNSGMVMGEQMFTCQPGHGLFVRGEDLSLLVAEGTSKALFLGSLVNWRGHLGRVRYLGRVHFEGGENWVGLELDRAVGKNDGTVQGRSYFKCQDNHGVVTRDTNVEQVRLWSTTYVESRKAQYIESHDIDVLTGQLTGKATSKSEMIDLELKAVEGRLRAKYGEDFRLADFMTADIL